MTVPATPAQLRAALVAHGLLAETGVPGLFHRSRSFELIVRGVEQAFAQQADDPALPCWFLPPLMPREAFVRTDYLRSFPDLVGSIDAFTGNDRDHADLLRELESGRDWTAKLEPSEVVLSSAACHSLYGLLPTIIAPGGLDVECQGFVFRHEPSLDPARMQSFRMHEFVHVGTPESAMAHRDKWLQRGLAVFSDLGLAVEAEVASDPFFGRIGGMLADNQRDAALKYEIVVSLTQERTTAVASANCHLDHFGEPFGLHTEDGEPAHSACFGVGLERTALALLVRHGFDPAHWPAGVAERLWP